MNRQHVSRAEVRRRRVGVAVFAGLLALTTLFLLLPRGGEDLHASDPSPSPTPTGHRDDTPSSREPVPTWLAWMPGGFPEGAAAAFADDPALGRTVVVAGDTLWMTASRDAGGVPVDEPAPPYRIPIDAFSAAPAPYAPFLPAALRDEIAGALRRGQAVLGATSAELRRLGPGGVLVFGDREVEVGAVAPDRVVGWSEMLVNPAVGRSLGIAHDRYLLALGDGDMTMPAFRAAVLAPLPAGTTLRTVRPGGTRFVRVASGVNPPVVTKTVFGEFAAAPRADDPAFLDIDPAWHAAHIVTEEVPILGDVTCNEALMPQLRGALQDLADSGLGDLIDVYSGCYAARTVARSPTAPPSTHAYGASIDIDAPENGYGDTTPAMDPRVVAVFERWGFIWGGDFLIPDGMHFEYGGPPEA